MFHDLSFHIHTDNGRLISIYGCQGLYIVYVSGATSLDHLDLSHDHRNQPLSPQQVKKRVIKPQVFSDHTFALDQRRVHSG